jgi:hypothetical protein
MTERFFTEPELALPRAGLPEKVSPHCGRAAGGPLYLLF